MVLFGALHSETSVSFNYNSNGLDWKTAFPTCGGNTQSPVPLPVATAEAFASNTFQLTLRSDNFTITPSGLQNATAAGSFSKLKISDVNGTTSEFSSVNFHIHVVSEHTINGQAGDVELHIVHSQATDSHSSGGESGKLAVVGILFKESTTSSSFFDNWALNGPPGARSFNMAQAMADIVRLAKGYYRYSGSLTTPPCSEVVEWFVLDGFFPISTAQKAYLRSLFPGNLSFAAGNGNNRALQALNGRHITWQTFNNNNGFGQNYVGSSALWSVAAILTLLSQFIRL